MLSARNTSVDSSDESSSDSHNINEFRDMFASMSEDSIVAAEPIHNISDSTKSHSRSTSPNTKDRSSSVSTENRSHNISLESTKDRSRSRSTSPNTTTDRSRSTSPNTKDRSSTKSHSRSTSPDNSRGRSRTRNSVKIESASITLDDNDEYTVVDQPSNSIRIDTDLNKFNTHTRSGSSSPKTSTVSTSTSTGMRSSSVERAPLSTSTSTVMRSSSVERAPLSTKNSTVSTVMRSNSPKRSAINEHSNTVSRSKEIPLGEVVVGIIKKTYDDNTLQNTKSRSRSREIVENTKSRSRSREIVEDDSLQKKRDKLRKELEEEKQELELLKAKRKKLLEKELEQERLEKKRLKKEALKREREQERLEEERREKKRLKKESLKREQERLEQERLEQEALAREQERLEQERIEIEYLEKKLQNLKNRRNGITDDTECDVTPIEKPIVKSIPQIEIVTRRSRRHRSSNKKHSGSSISKSIKVPKGQVLVRTPTGDEYIIPDYDAMSYEDQLMVFDKYETLFKSMNIHCKEADLGYSFRIPTRDEPLRNIHVRHLESMSLIKRAKGMDITKICMIGCWTLIQWTMNKLGFDAQDYLVCQLRMYDVYETKMIEMGEVHRIGEDWSPMVQVAFISVVNLVVVVLLNTCFKGFGDKGKAQVMKLVSSVFVKTKSENGKKADMAANVIEVGEKLLGCSKAGGLMGMGKMMMKMFNGGGNQREKRKAAIAAKNADEKGVKSKPKSKSKSVAKEVKKTKDNIPVINKDLAKRRPAFS